MNIGGDLIIWIVGIVGALLGVGGLYVKGRSDGKSKEKEKQNEANRKAEQKHAQTVDKSKDVAISVGKLPDDDVSKRLRDKYTRD